jgi:heme oxygenase (biliverdin-IX-beta and delta-forming)
MRGQAHECLRKKTRGLHEQLDGGLDLTVLGTREGYTAFLEMNWPCACIEMALEKARICRILPDWDRRRRRFALEADLKALDRVCPSVQMPQLSDDAGTLLGWSYVLEGSRMGARVILRSILTSADLQLAEATQFLRHGDGADFWASFKSVLTTIDDQPQLVQNACVGARSAFACFIARRPMFSDACNPRL